MVNCRFLAALLLLALPLLPACRDQGEPPVVDPAAQVTPLVLPSPGATAAPTATATVAWIDFEENPDEYLVVQEGPFPPVTALPPATEEPEETGEPEETPAPDEPPLWPAAEDWPPAPLPPPHPDAAWPEEMPAAVEPGPPTGVSVALARAAAALLREADLDPAAEVQTRSVSRAALSRKAQDVIRNSELDYRDVREAFKAYPETLSETPEQIAAAARQAEEERAQYYARMKAGWMEGLPQDRFEGWGAQATGGRDGEEITIAQPTDGAVRAAFEKAAKNGNCRLVFRVAGAIDIGQQLPVLQRPNVSIEGMGMATLWGSGLPSNRAVIPVSTDNVIIRDLRIRHGGDNISLGGGNYNAASNVMISHVSSTASRDDGISAGYGARDVTIQWCYVGGCTRSIFIKYRNSRNISVHHNLIDKQMMRGPLIYHANVDFRNNIVRDWRMWATRFQSGGSGNAINNLHFLSEFGRRRCMKPNSSIYRYQNGDGRIYTEGNVARNCGRPLEGNEEEPMPAPPVVTQSVEEMEPLVLERAGCLPRDQIDEEYLQLREFDVSVTRPFLIGR